MNVGSLTTILIDDMKRLKRIGLVVGVAILAAGGFGIWYVYGAWPVPEGYEFPRHSEFGGPSALFEGELQELEGCVRAATDFGAFTVVWPPGYSLTLDQGEPIVNGGALRVRMGEPVRMGGGYYESGDPPPGARDLGDCPAPYFFSTGFVED
jgi:hypothetical protein